LPTPGDQIKGEFERLDREIRADLGANNLQNALSKMYTLLGMKNELLEPEDETMARQLAAVQATFNEANATKIAVLQKKNIGQLQKVEKECDKLMPKGGEKVKANNFLKINNLNNERRKYLEAMLQFQAAYQVVRENSALRNQSLGIFPPKPRKT